ncbi:hydantoinase/carbamoylase family amidase [Pseudoroseomonas cervicalis]|uniref:hydantoinase/carbamoylase family amidase n=1 Tax=Teichococcus cervicalis TaxID=204525 RepID=UPI0035EEA848
MPAPASDAALAAHLLALFRQLSADGEGVTRPAYGAAEGACLDVLAGIARAEGLEAWPDAAGNLWMQPPGLGEAPAPACGSHMDSVPQGGNFDGAAGVVAGLLCARQALREGRRLRAVALRGEESPWFGAPHVGLRAAFGALGAAELAIPRRDSGRTLAEHMREQGADPAAAGRGAPPLPELRRTNFFWELHIEQGPVLVDRGLPAAAVSAVRGHVRYPGALCQGEAGHSGAVPRHLRRDPALAVAELLHELDTLWGRALQEGADLVLTAGQLWIDPASATATRIPDAVRFSLDLRSAQPAVLAELAALLPRRAAEIGARRGVRFDLGQAVRAAPVLLDEAARAAIEAALPEPVTLASGAGHDAAEFVRRGTPAAMVFIRNRNGSHNPAEAMEMEDFLAGLAAMQQAIRAAG